jgi:hypothetical protein
VNRALRGGAAIAVALVVAGGCGGKGDGMSSAAQQRLATLVGRVRAAATARDAGRTDRALAALRDEVRRDRAAGSLTPQRADRILGAAAAVQTQVALITPTTTTTTTLPPAPTAPPDGEHDHGKHGGKHKDEGDQGD